MPLATTIAISGASDTNALTYRITMSTGGHFRESEGAPFCEGSLGGAVRPLAKAEADSHRAPAETAPTSALRSRRACG